MEFRKFEQDGRFGVAYWDEPVPDGTIGRGGCEVLHVFASANEREMYIELIRVRRRLREVEVERDLYLNAIEETASIRGAWRHLWRALREHF